MLTFAQSAKPVNPPGTKARAAAMRLATIQGAMLMGKIKRSSQSVEAVAREAVAHVKSYLVKS